MCLELTTHWILPLPLASKKHSRSNVESTYKWTSMIGECGDAAGMCLGSGLYVASGVVALCACHIPRLT